MLREKLDAVLPRCLERRTYIFLDFLLTCRYICSVNLANTDALNNHLLSNNLIGGNMKRFLVLILAIGMIGSAALAQEFQPATKAGAKSLNFSYAGLGTFSIGPSGVNSGLGLSYFMSSDAAIRLGLQVKMTSSTTPWNDPTNTNPGVDGSSSTFGVGFGADYLMYMYSMTPRVKPFMGLGASVAINSSDIKQSVANSAANGTLLETKNGLGNEGLTFGLAGIAGAEFFLYSELSLSAEYQLNLFKTASNADKTVSVKGQADATTKQGNSSQILGFGAAGATLHIYF